MAAPVGTGRSDLFRSVLARIEPGFVDAERVCPAARAGTRRRTRLLAVHLQRGHTDPRVSAARRLLRRRRSRHWAEERDHRGRNPTRAARATARRALARSLGALGGANAPWQHGI